MITVSMKVSGFALAGLIGFGLAAASAVTPAAAQQEILEKELRGLDVVGGAERPRGHHEGHEARHE